MGIERPSMQTQHRNQPIEAPQGGASILIVDDSKQIVNLLSHILTLQGHNCDHAFSAEEAQEKLVNNKYDLVLSDMKMGDMTGIDLIENIFKKYPDTATILVTGEDDPSLGQKAIQLGAYGYVIKPFNKNELTVNVTNALIRRKLSIENKNYQGKLEHTVMERTKELMESITRLERAEERLKDSQAETIARLARAAEFRDNETAHHIQRMSLYSELLARKVGLDNDRCELILAASPMHDIGKLGTPDAILLKPGKLTEEEFEIMKNHAEIGYRILSGSSSELLETGALIARSHHEKWDGSGYPQGLTGENIPLEGRIVAIADVFDALTSKRVYKPAMDVAEAETLMRDGSGKHFDPELLDLFFESLPEILAIKNANQDD